MIKWESRNIKINNIHISSAPASCLNLKNSSKQCSVKDVSSYMYIIVIIINLIIYLFIYLLLLLLLLLLVVVVVVVPCFCSLLCLQEFGQKVKLKYMQHYETLIKEYNSSFH